MDDLTTPPEISELSFEIYDDTFPGRDEYGIFQNMMIAVFMLLRIGYISKTSKLNKKSDKSLLVR